MNPVLEHLKVLAEQGLHPNAIMAEMLPDSVVIQTVFDDFVDAREGASPLPIAPPGVTVGGWERYPDDWMQIQARSPEDVEEWIHETAWITKAIDWVRREIVDPGLPDHMISGIYGPYAEEATEMLRSGIPRISWMFKANKWPRSRESGAFRYSTSKRPHDDIPTHVPYPLGTGAPLSTTTGGEGFERIRRFRS